MTKTPAPEYSLRNNPEVRRLTELVRRMSAGLAVITLGLAGARALETGAIDSLVTILVITGIALVGLRILAGAILPAAVCGGLVPALGLAALTSMAFFENGIQSEAIVWIPFAPLLAAIVAGAAGAIAYGVASIVVLGIIYYSTSEALLQQIITLGLKPQLMFAAAIGATIFGAIIGYLFESGRKVTQYRIEDVIHRQRQILERLPDLMLIVREDGEILEQIDPLDHNSWMRSWAKAAASLHSLTGLAAGAIESLVESITKGVGAGMHRLSVQVGNQARQVDVHIMELDGERWLVAIRDLTEQLKAERMREEFVAVVSHELRTPLTSIRGALGMLANENVRMSKTETDTLVSAAERNSIALQTIVDDLLDFQKLSLGQMAISIQSVSLPPFLSDVKQQFGLLSKSRNVDIEVVCAEGLVLDADPERLSQLVGNLVSNAIKFSPADSTVRIMATSGPDIVTIAVSDMGPGIPDDQKDLVFNKFFQLAGHETRGNSGTGLGLAIVQQIALLHGGAVRAEDANNVGSQFVVELPKSAA